MSRFDNLEFGADPAPAAPAAPPGEGALLAEADDLYHRGRYELALHAYTRAVDRHPSQPEAWTGQVRMLVELDELREAWRWSETALARFPLQPELLATRAVVRARMADLRTALALADAAMAERGTTPYVWLARGEVLLARGESPAAFCLNQALTLARGDWRPPWQAARIHRFHRKFADALTYAEMAVERAPTRAVAWLEAAFSHRALRHSEAAETACAHVRRLDPDCPELASRPAKATGPESRSD